MPHALHRATIALQTPLGTPLAGDTLFGQLCWALLEAKGETELARQLDGYTAGAPWLVVSDGFPSGFLPKPTLPQHFEPQSDPSMRKQAKKQHWIPASNAGQALPSMLSTAVDDATAYGRAPLRTAQAHNSLSRFSGTTGEGAFAPYSMPQTFHAAEQRIDLYFVLDEERTSQNEVRTLLAATGLIGFGRDAGIGLGKFTIEALEPAPFARSEGANAHWTLAPSAPQGMGFDQSRSYWRVLTRFGRHGNSHALSRSPFKTPIILAATGAVFTPAGNFAACPFIGQGLGGGGALSRTEPATVHQGYAPALPIALESTPP